MSHSSELRAPSLLFIGQLTPRKGYDLVMQALPEVLRYHPAARLLIVSGLNPADRATMEAMARDLQVAEHVEFLGRVDDGRLINLFRDADLYVTPTRYEGFGLTLLEAMAAGCPIVASDIPVVEEIIRHGENGWLVRYDSPRALAEGIVHLLDHPELRGRLGAGGERTLREQFAEPMLVEQIEQIYQRTMAERARPGEASE